jgi:hypothetical protein
MMNQFYIAVVEDRNDPLKLGRVRVRVINVHSEDRKSDVPIDSLPWSYVMQPPNTSTSGAPLSQLVEGTWVIVMYMDNNLQDPLVMGSIPGINRIVPNFEIGFSDPFGVNPRWTGSAEEGDSNLSLITDEERWQEHPTYEARKDNRVTEIQQAKKYEVPTVSSTTPDEEYERTTWDEPDLRGSQESNYPYNSVREFEAGQLEEVDSTSDNTRITNSHQSGSYHEILHDGTTTTKIVGEGYSITLKDHNMFVQGDLNLTVEGNMRHMVEGDYTLEVGGSMFTYVDGNRETKINSSDVKEISVDESINVLEKRSIRVGGDQRLMIDGNEIKTVAKNSDTSIKGDHSQTIHSNSSGVIIGDESLVTIGKRLVTTEGIHRFESAANIEFDTDANVLETIAGLRDTQIGSDLTQSIGGSQNTQVSSTIDITAGGDITLVGGPNINLNP